jgi:hypothetical protein
MEKVLFQEGRNIYTKGDDPKYFYLIKHGKVEFRITYDEPLAFMKTTKGYFGEWEIMTD